MPQSLSMTEKGYQLLDRIKSNPPTSMDDLEYQYLYILQHLETNPNFNLQSKPKLRPYWDFLKSQGYITSGTLNKSDLSPEPTNNRSYGTYKACLSERRSLNTSGEGSECEGSKSLPIISSPMLNPEPWSLKPPEGVKPEFWWNKQQEE